MSFSYKTLNSTDITLTSYIANKQWEVKNSTLSQNGVTIYVGENLPVTKDNPFNPIDDGQTSNDEYRRLIFESIKHLYYENYISASLNGQFFNSSSYFNYEQSTLVSGTIRNLTTITGSNLNPSEPAIYDNPSSHSLFDSVSTLYDLDTLDPDAGSRVVVISIDKNIYGSGLSPKSVNISGSTYNIQDDGEGNLLDTLATSSLYVGNVFYSQGLIIITNQNYLCALGIPPTAVNNYFSYNNTTPDPTLDILGNDYTDCGNLDYTSFLPNTIPGYTFPNYTQNNGIMTITPDQTSVIPGNYQLGYTIASSTGIRSNTASINLTITSQSLEIDIISNGSTCYGTSSLAPVTCSINYGVPYYSWSFDGGLNYSSSNSLTGITVSGSILSSTSSLIYVKDYTGTIYSSSFNSWYPGISYTYEVQLPPCGNTGSAGEIYIYSTTAVSASLNGSPSQSFSGIYSQSFFNNTTTSSTLLLKNIYGCVTSSIINISPIQVITSSLITSSVSCFGGSNGSFSLSLTNIYPGLNPQYTIQTGSNILPAFNGIEVNTTSYVFATSSLPAGIYTASAYFDGGNSCNLQNYLSYITINQPTQITFSATASYIDSCSNAVIFNATGGTPPYTYFAAETVTGFTYSSNFSSVSLTNLSGSTYNLAVLDSNGCLSSSSLLNVFGRQFEYSGSECSGSTGFLSSSAIQQNFTSGPYSGSIVTSSYSSGSILSGPIVNFKQLFTSGTIDNIFVCNTNYLRLFYNPTVCPPGGCNIPILTTATPSDCNNFNGNYDVSYNSGSTDAVYTYIQYSTDPTFTSNVTASVITNSFPSMLPIDVNNLPSPPISYFTSVYFRAYNSCSVGTSLFSNVIEANCDTPPPPPYDPFTILIENQTGTPIIYTSSNTTGNITVYENETSSYIFSDIATQFRITLIRTPGYLEPNQNGNYDFVMNVSSSNAVNCEVFTTVIPILGNTIYSPTSFYCGYIEGGTDADFDTDDNVDTYDVEVDIDRSTYTSGGTITFNITPKYSPY
jgi:hypothetical protein